MPLRRADIGHRLDDLVLVGERRGEPLGEVSNSAVVIVQRDAVGRVEGEFGCERGHRSTVPKHAATHAQLRTGAIHSTTPIIGLPSRGIASWHWMSVSNQFRHVYGTAWCLGSCLPWTSPYPWGV